MNYEVIKVSLNKKDVAFAVIKNITEGDTIKVVSETQNRLINGKELSVGDKFFDLIVKGDSKYAGFKHIGLIKNEPPKQRVTPDKIPNKNVVKNINKSYNNKQIDWEARKFSMIFGNMMNVCALHLKYPNKETSVEAVGELTLELIPKVGVVRDKLLQEFSQRSEDDVGAKLAEGLKHAAGYTKKQTLDELVAKGEEWCRACIKWEEIVKNGGKKEDVEEPVKKAVKKSVKEPVKTTPKKEIGDKPAVKKSVEKSDDFLDDWEEPS